MTDPDAKNLQAWKFGDILGHDRVMGGAVGAIRCMFVAHDESTPAGRRTFHSMDLTTSPGTVMRRFAAFWVRIEKAPE